MESPYTSRVRSAALGCTFLAACALASSARADEGRATVITVSAPQGFDNLTQEQTLVVDIYFGRVRRGEARIRATPGGIGFADPEAVLRLLPPLHDRSAVEAALGASLLPANSQLACSLGSDQAECGRLVPDVAGVIFDRDNFRVEVFVNPTFLAVEDRYADAYLPTPDGKPTLISSLGAIVSGRIGESDTIYNIQNSLVAGFGEQRLRADLSYAAGYGLQADRLNLEWDRPGLRYSAGAMWAPGSELGGTRKIIGAGVTSQIDTRRDKEELFGSPLVVYLDQRARIDVMRDGRLLGSAVYSAGNQQIATDNLPEGSYEIVLRIDEPGRPVREETRLFTKSRKIPSLGRTDFYAYAGMEVAGLERGSLRPSDHPYGQAGVVRRLSRHWALSGGAEADDRGASAEFAATFLSDIAQVRAAGLVGFDGDYGAILQVTSSGSTQLNYNFDLRHIAGRGLYRSGAGEGREPGLPLSSDRFGGSYSQASGLVSYSFANVRLLGSVIYRDDENGRARYSIGPSAEWDVLRRGPFILSLRGDMTATERGTAGFAGISLRMTGIGSSFTALTGARASGIAGDDLGEGLVTTAAGAWSPGFAGGDLALGAGVERRSTQKFVTGSAELRNRLGSLTGDLVHSRIGDEAGTQYALGLQSSIVAGAGGIRLAGKATSDSAIVVSVRGARQTDRFEVLVDEQVAGTLTGSRSLRLPLPPYRAYMVRIRPTGGEPVAYDGATREVGLYPGSVSAVSWTAAPISIRIGRLLGADGTPLAGASITSKGVWAETDQDGYFQIEAADDAQFDVSLSDGRTYRLTLPAGEPGGGVTRLGAVVCCAADTPHLGALDTAPQPFNGEPK